VFVFVFVVVVVVVVAVAVGVGDRRLAPEAPSGSRPISREEG
jgi:hypothetical protein